MPPAAAPSASSEAAVPVAAGIAGVATAIDLAASRAFLETPVAIHVAPGRAASTTLRILSTYRGQDGLPCRKVRETVLIDGQHVSATATICQHSNGRWGLVR
jgi:surface antigen